ncbi:hypothetical protein ACGF1Z_30260 [Streptomyces sp. NPDC048018]|uniref:hypothetical protein n=1 Tax=Streptomyces sp. NPDC048018 TaxID=3365499 RepID=UPI003720B82C
MLKRLHERAPREQDGPGRIREHLDTARGLLHDLRREMRLDLGITRVPHPRREREPDPSV